MHLFIKTIKKINNFIFFYGLKEYNKSRNEIFSKRMISCESKIYGYDIHINKPENIQIGKNVFIGNRVILDAYGIIKIADNVQIASDVKIISGNHRFQKNILIKDQSYDIKPVVIMNDVWLGFNVIVLPGCTISEGCIIAAGAVVTKSTLPFGIYAGIPAKLLNFRL